MTEMLRAFAKICADHNLKFWCIGGTFIGTLRHKGWIPYDGDLDVGMMEEDYAILKKFRGELPPDLYFQDKELDPLYTTHDGMAKILHLHSHYIEKAEQPAHRGLQLDIFLHRKILNTIYPIVRDSTFDGKPMPESLLFPLVPASFEGIQVYMPNKTEEYCRKRWGAYPPPLLPVGERRPHEGLIDSERAHPRDVESYPHLYRNGSKKE
jgi:phosphorylcholine metabolism protein LicD